ncbi:conserved hypothetical protein [Talaromyces stipitatus ATCC 10500]|uniref:MULE transposase domain-containing protein n=1 Tax=Talaromyces stipitatus (strain ATCC 10500 / CBS 375.48 / QM 6759 / NRRL 1006) TaxID=441959 RepID=B8MTT1_TALSN|nr:uncharacterized protein TSTA_005960 [Talaromyces stipitatus ATCC 10500]EED12566.1 conserved hypothetical protein [Talaromyces stipitatus ATCC 10500]
METPFDQAYESRDKMLAELRRYALSQGYVITTIRSNPGKNITIGCDRGGEYTDRINALDGAKRRRTSTRRIGCSFRLYGYVHSRGPQADGRWRIKVKNLEHSHELEGDLIAHPAARTITSEQRITICNQLDEGIPPRQIISLIKKSDPTLLIIPMDLYNLRKAFLREQLAGRTPIQYLQEQLLIHKWKFAFKQDIEGCITFFMFAHPESIQYANQFNRVFILDCTYKTNRYEMPLLHIIGVSPSNTTFSVAFCFMQNEQEESYKWALKTFFSWLESPMFQLPVLCTDRDLAILATLRDDYPESPHLLCLWHINKNIAAKVKEYFATSEAWDEFLSGWQSLVNSPTEHEYEARLLDFDKKYQSVSPYALRYIKETWLIYKEKASTGDILTVWGRVRHAVHKQIDALVYEVRHDQLNSLIFCQSFLYSQINQRASHYAINRVHDQVNIAKRATSLAPLPECSNSFTRTMGLPCAHRIARLLEKKHPIPLTDIHPFWRQNIAPDNRSEYLPLLEPRLPIPKAKRSDKKGGNPKVDVEKGTPTATATGKRKAPSKCSNCGVIGHTIRSCKVK